MYRWTFEKDGETFERINRTEARRRFDQFETIYIIPNKCRLFNHWIFPAEINKGINGSAFEIIDNTYRFYNCNSAQLGKYPAYYVKQRSR